MEQGEILAGKVLRCDTQHRLIVDLDGWTGIIPETECVAPFISGAGKGIALLSCVGRAVSFLVTNMYNRYVREDGGAYTRVPEPDTPPRAEEKPPYRPQQASRPFSPPPPPDEEEAQAPEAKFPS